MGSTIDEWVKPEESVLAYAVSVLGSYHPFYISCKTFYEKKGFLTRKQMDGLSKVKVNNVLYAYTNYCNRGGDHPNWLSNTEEPDLKTMYDYVGGTYIDDGELDSLR